MSAAARLWLAVGLLLPALGCEQLGCGAPGHLAELISVQGEVQRDFANATGQWRPVEGEERFSMGDGLRTGPGATARLKLVPRGAVLVDGDTLVRFRAKNADQAARLDVEIGSIELDSADGALSLETVVGMIRIDRGSRVRVRGRGEQQRLDVLLGKLFVERDGKDEEVSAGQELLVDIGGITLDPKETEPEPSPTPLAVPDAGAPPDAPADDVDEVDDMNDVAESATVVEADPAAPRRAALTIAAGESATVHDPRPPTNVRVPFDACPGGGQLEVARGRRFNHRRTRGPEAGIVRLKPGSYRYRVRCVDADPKAQPAASGRIVIRRDAGTRRLPTRAPRVTVDADGRPYTVRYQNLLPRISVRWPDPPAAAGYRLELTGERSGKTRTRKLKRPSHTYRSGQMREGTHRFRFTTADGKHAAEGTVRVKFDNAARTAYLSVPATALAKGRASTFSGAALTGSDVRVDGTGVEIDPQGRFSATVAPDGRHDAVAVRVQHRASGVHYYLRRLR